MFATYMVPRLEEELANTVTALSSHLDDDKLGFVAGTTMVDVHPRTSNDACSSNITTPVMDLECKLWLPLSHTDMIMSVWTKLYPSPPNFWTPLEIMYPTEGLLYQDKVDVNQQNIATKRVS